MTIATYQPIIHAAEVWTADESNALRPSESLTDFKLAVAKEVVERAATTLSPVIVHRDDLENSNGVTDFQAAMAIPIIADRQVKACLVLSLACPTNSMGAFEIWSRDERDELGLNGAVFSGLRRFATISNHVRFPRGSGLPGQSWEDRQAKLITGLGSNPNFMRAAGARAGGLDVGVGLPVMTTEHDLNSVILILSSVSTPIAKLFEVWDIEDTEAKLRTSASTNCEASETEARAMTYTMGEGIVGKVWASGVPIVTGQLSSVEVKRIASLTSDSLTNVIAIPVYVGKTIKSVFLMFN